MLDDFSEAMFQFEDWNTPTDEMPLLDSLRSSHGEKRWLIHAPCHLFAPAERSEIIVHCYLTGLLDWTAYLYLGPKSGTFYFWEGDLIDYFGSDKETNQKIQEIIQHYKLRVTYAA